MAAAEYYNGDLRPSPSQNPSFLAPPRPPQRSSSNPGFSSSQRPPYQPSSPHLQPHMPPPPPYQQYNANSKPNVHFAPTPSPLGPPRHSFSNTQRPNPQPWVGPPPPAQTHLQPSPYPAAPNTGAQYSSYQPQPYPYQQQTYPAPHFRPSMNASQSQVALGGYSSDPESRRRRHRHREKREGRTREQRISETSRSTAADGFLGAAGGGLIGDLIFPGLGTVGGALAGWLGGRDYGKHRKWREDKRDRVQHDWERKYSRDRDVFDDSDEDHGRYHESERHHDRKRSDY